MNAGSWMELGEEQGLILIFSQPCTQIFPSPPRWEGGRPTKAGSAFHLWDSKTLLVGETEGIIFRDRLKRSHWACHGCHTRDDTTTEE